MATVSQPTPNPTNKLTAAIIGSAVCELARVILANLAPGWAEPSLWVALSPIIIFLCGYFVKDAPNVVPDPMQEIQ